MSKPGGKAGPGAPGSAATRSLRDLSGEDRALLNRWRLVLGKTAEQRGIGFSPGAGEGDCEGAESALSYLYEQDERGAGVRQ